MQTGTGSFTLLAEGIGFRPAALPDQSHIIPQPERKRNRMFLLTAATDFEMKPFLAACREQNIPYLVTGIGPVETTVRLSARLRSSAETISGVVNFGVAGAYVRPSPQNTPRAPGYLPG